jgi:hypothetical protein
LISTNYALGKTDGLRTGIDIVSTESFSMNGPFSQPTTLLTTPSSLSWINTATEQFETAVRGASTCEYFIHFMSAADALTSFLFTPAAAFAEVASELSGQLRRADKPDPSYVIHTNRIIGWLGLTYDQLSTITGISRATFFNWRRPGTTARAENVRQIERLYAISSLLARRFGDRGLHAWLQSGGGTTWDQLLSGNLSAVEEAVKAELFRQNNQDFNVVETDDAYLDVPPQRDDVNSTPRRAARRPTRGRLRSE